MAAALLAGERDLAEARVAFLEPPGFAYAALLRGIWAAGGVAVPLAVSHPAAELAHAARDSETGHVVVAHPGFARTLAPIAQAAGS